MLLAFGLSDGKPLLEATKKVSDDLAHLCASVQTRHFDVTSCTIHCIILGKHCVAHARGNPPKHNRIILRPKTPPKVVLAFWCKAAICLIGIGSLSIPVQSPYHDWSRQCTLQLRGLRKAWNELSAVAQDFLGCSGVSVEAFPSGSSHGKS